MNERILLSNIDKIHTTKLGIERIKKNMDIKTNNVVDYCKSIIIKTDCKINQRGKNWYCDYNNIRITINKYSYTIITAHIIK